MSAMRKFNQAGLRKLIQEQNSKTQKPKAEVEKIQSPLAKYDAAGVLHCIICKIPVKPNVWKVHINSKQHKQKTEEAKSIVEKCVTAQPANAAGLLAKSSTSNLATTPTTIVANPNKRKATNASSETSTTTTAQNSKIPAIATAVPEINKTNTTHASIIPIPTSDPLKDNTASDTLESVLPEKFFDDPQRDVNGQMKDQTKDPLEDEWKRFQHEIKAETSVSYTIVAGQQDEAAIDREIEEIDEQLKRWQKVVEFENKTAEVLKNKKSVQRNGNKNDIESDDDDDDDDVVDDATNGDDFIEFWRTKKLKL